MVFSSGGAASLARLVNFSAGGNSKTSGWLVFDFPLERVVQGGSCGSDLSLRTVKDGGSANFLPGGGAASLARLVNFSAGGNSKTSGWLVFDFPLQRVVQGGSCGSDLSLRTVKDGFFLRRGSQSGQTCKFSFLPSWR
jgi:hypothetical protein